LPARAQTAEPDAAPACAHASAFAIPKELHDFPEFQKDSKLLARWDELSGSWKQACPTVNISQELAKAHSYAVKKKAEGYPYRNFVRYLTSWMFRQQEKASRLSRPKPERHDDLPVVRAVR
jgi:hypothetical protein